MKNRKSFYPVRSYVWQKRMNGIIRNKNVSINQKQTVLYIDGVFQGIYKGYKPYYPYKRLFLS